MTVLQAPEEDYFSVHIRILGDWTAEVARQMGAGRTDFQQSWELPKYVLQVLKVDTLHSIVENLFTSHFHVF